MLTRSSLTLLTLLAAASGACVINNTPDGSGGEGGGTNVTNGTGGDGTTATTSTGGGGTGGQTNGSGGGGGGPTCTDPAGTGVPATACDNTNVGSITVCPSGPNFNEAPLANLTCDRGNELYTPGAWEELLACIEAIPATTESACDEPTATNLVAACVGDMYANACANPTNDANCEANQAACDANGQTGYPTATCKDDLKPFSTDGYAEYVDCFNNSDPNILCADIHDHCMDVLTTL